MKNHVQLHTDTQKKLISSTQLANVKPDFRTTELYFN